MTFPICIGPFFNLGHAQNENNDGKNSKFKCFKAPLVDGFFVLDGQLVRNYLLFDLFYVVS